MGAGTRLATHRPMASSSRCRRALLLAAGALAMARSVTACGQRCPQPTYDERAAEGQLVYADERVNLVMAAGALGWDLPPETPAQGRGPAVEDGRLKWTWTTTVPASPGTAADVITFRLDISMKHVPIGESPLVGALCACRAYASPDSNGRCVPLGGAPSGPAECEPLHGTLVVDENELECEDGAPTICAEQLAILIYVPEAEGKRLHGSLELRSIQSIEYETCGSGGNSMGCNPPQGNLT